MKSALIPKLVYWVTYWATGVVLIGGALAIVGVLFAVSTGLWVP